jgi:hypothetical protein
VAIRPVIEPIKYDHDPADTHRVDEAFTALCEVIAVWPCDEPASGNAPGPGRFARERRVVSTASHRLSVAATTVTAGPYVRYLFRLRPPFKILRDLAWQTRRECESPDRGSSAGLSGSRAAESAQIGWSRLQVGRAEEREMNDLAFMIVDPDRYRPVESSQLGTKYAPGARGTRSYAAARALVFLGRGTAVRDRRHVVHLLDLLGRHGLFDCLCRLGVAA